MRRRLPRWDVRRQQLSLPNVQLFLRHVLWRGRRRVRRLLECVSLQGRQLLRRELPHWHVRGLGQGLSELRRQLRQLLRPSEHAVLVVSVLYTLSSRRPVPCSLPHRLLRKRRIVVRGM